MLLKNLLHFMDTSILHKHHNKVVRIYASVEIINKIIVIRLI